MKNFSEKLTMALAVFSPIIILIFIWTAYLYTPPKEQTHMEIKLEIENNAQHHSYRAKEDKFYSVSVN